MELAKCDENNLGLYDTTAMPGALQINASDGSRHS